MNNTCRNAPSPVLTNTCRGPQASMLQCAGCLPPHTDHIQQDIRPTDRPSAAGAEDGGWRRLCSRSAADPRAPARRRHWAGAPRLPPRLARAAGAGPGTSHVEVAPFLPFQEHRPRTAAYICCLRREREIGEIGVCRSATSRNIPLFYKFLSAAIRQAAECHTERDTIKASTFHSQFHHWGRSSRPSAPEPRTELVAAWPGLRAERLPPVPEDALVQPICSRSSSTCATSSLGRVTRKNSAGEH